MCSTWAAESGCSHVVSPRKVSRSPVSTRQRHRWPLPGASLVQIECDGSLATPPRCLRWKPTGRLVFEVRDPARRGWREWNRADSISRVAIAGLGTVEYWVELTEVSLPMVSFTQHYRFDDGSLLTSDSTLRFRERDEIVASLSATGFSVLEVREAPDRPGREFVFVCGVASSQGQQH